VAAAITDVPGASDVFLGGVVTYADDAKQTLLGVHGDTLRCHGAVSAHTAEEMARGVRERLGADIAVSVTGIAGPGGGTREKPVGLVWFCIVSELSPYAVLHERVFPGASRDAVRKRATAFALDLLRMELLRSRR
jgi:PncC family amidohydrolase